jgi:hypothetical protein
LAPVLLLMLSAAPPARADLGAPEMFVRDLDINSAPVGDWQPLAGAQLHSVNGQQLGARLQASGQPGNAQRFLAAMTTVPDGHADQRDVYNLCPIKHGEVGEIVALDGLIHYEGDGVYGVKMTATTGTTSGTGCDAGPSSPGEFSVATPASIVLAGVPLLNPLDEKYQHATLTVSAPLGASRADVLCARNPVRQPDGSLAGAAAHTVVASPSAPVQDEALYTEPGYWSCVARGTAENAGPWSEPTPLTFVQADYRGLYSPFKLGDTTGPRYRFSAKGYPVAPGATVTLEASPVKGCTAKGKILLRRSGRRTAKARMGATGTVSFGFRLPPAPADGRPVYYLLSSTLTGAKLLRTEKVQDIGLALERKGRRTVGRLVLALC